MKKIVALSLALGLSTTAFAFDTTSFTSGDGTYHVVKPTKPSDLTRAEVLKKTESMNLANSLDSSVSPEVRANPMLSRAEVIRKMEGFQFADFGDSTNPTPWVKMRDDTRNLAQDHSNTSVSKTN